MTTGRVVHDRQVDRVAVAAEPRVPDVVVVLRRDAERRLHRMRGRVLVLERPEDVGGGSRRELAGDVVLEKPPERILARRGPVGDDAMARGAADAVARERAVLEIPAGGR